MAINSNDREDLLREATALVRRIELAVPSISDHVVIGFRSNGSCSIFFGFDPVYQFNSSCELRRAYVDGCLIKADRQKLASLTRKREEGKVILQRHDLNDDETRELLETAAEFNQRLRTNLHQKEFRFCGQFPKYADVLGEVSRWLDEISTPIRIAGSPHVR